MEFGIRTLPSLIQVEITVRYKTKGFTRLDRSNTHERLRPARGESASGKQAIWSWAHTCTQRRKKLRLKSDERTYLFMTVIKIDEPQ